MTDRLGALLEPLPELEQLLEELSVATEQQLAELDVNEEIEQLLEATEVDLEALLEEPNP